MKVSSNEFLSTCWLREIMVSSLMSLLATIIIFLKFSMLCLWWWSGGETFNKAFNFERQQPSTQQTTNQTIHPIVQHPPMHQPVHPLMYPPMHPLMHPLMHQPMQYPLLGDGHEGPSDHGGQVGQVSTVDPHAHGSVATFTQRHRHCTKVRQTTPETR